MNMKNNYIFSLLLFIGFFCILEGFAQFYVQAKFSDSYPSSTTMIWEQPKGHRIDHGVPIFINEYGLRGLAPTIPKPLQKKRLMSVGDSSIFGFLVKEEDIFTSVAVQNVPDWEAINAGCPGYSSEQSLRWVEQFVPLFEIDLLVIGNLWSDSTHMGFSDRELFRRSKRNTPSFFAKSSTYQMFVSILSDIPSKIPWYDRNQDGENRVSPLEYKENLQSMIDIMTKQGGNVIFIALATRQEIEEEIIDTKGEQYRQIMNDIAQQNKIPMIDTNQKNIWKDQPDLFADLIHPNKKGHFLLGQALKQHLD